MRVNANTPNVISLCVTVIAWKCESRANMYLAFSHVKAWHSKQLTPDIYTEREILKCDMKIHRVLWVAHVYIALYGDTHNCGCMALQSNPIVITQKSSSIYRNFGKDAHRSFSHSNWAKKLIFLKLFLCKIHRVSCRFLTNSYFQCELCVRSVFHIDNF